MIEAKLLRKIESIKEQRELAMIGDYDYITQINRLEKLVTEMYYMDLIPVYSYIRIIKALS